MELKESLFVEKERAEIVRKAWDYAIIASGL